MQFTKLKPGVTLFFPIHFYLFMGSLMTSFLPSTGQLWLPVFPAQSGVNFITLNAGVLSAKLWHLNCLSWCLKRQKEAFKMPKKKRFKCLYFGILNAKIGV